MALKSTISKLIYNKQYKKDHREEILAYQKQYNKDHREEINAKTKQNYQDNREEHLTYQKQYCKDHREERNAYSKQYRKDHPEYMKVYNKQYSKDHPETFLKAQKKLFKKIGLTKYQIQTWTKVIRKGKDCSYCGSKKTLHSHHLIPKSKQPGLALNENNGIPLCVPCHKEHHMLNGVN